MGQVQNGRLYIRFEGHELNVLTFCEGYSGGIICSAYTQEGEAEPWFESYTVKHVNFFPSCLIVMGF